MITIILNFANNQLSFSERSDCVGLPDGVHAFGCQEEYTVCQAGRTLIGRCPRGLVFNGNTKRCDYLEACASQTTTGFESTTTSTPVPYSTTPAPQTGIEFCEDGFVVKVNFHINWFGINH